jgi:group I intron endonuclease
MSVVYRILNKNNGKQYIGSAGDDGSERLWKHRWMLENKRHDNPHLQRAWQQDSEHFVFEIIETYHERNDAYVAEQNWFDDRWDECHYNISRCATGFELGHQHSKGLNPRDWPRWYAALCAPATDKQKNTARIVMKKRWESEPEQTCQHCGKVICNRGMFVRWHGDNWHCNIACKTLRTCLG